MGCGRLWRAAGLSLVLAGGAEAQTSADYGLLYETLWRTVDESFYDPHFRGTDWARVRERYRDRAGRVESDEQFRALAAAMLAEIDASHLHLRAPESSARRVGVGALTARIGDADVVAEVAPLSDARRAGLRSGDRLVSPLESLPGELGSAAVVEIERCTGERERLSVRREQVPWPLELGGTQALIVDVRGNSGGNTSALRLGSYFGRGAEPAFVLLSRPFLERLGRPLRAADVVAAPRVDGAYTDAAVFEAVTSNGGGAAFWTEEPPRRFEGPVFVLIDENTASAAEGFAWYMRRHTDAVLIGRATAGELLSSERFPIGGGWVLTIPVHGVWGADGEDYGDRPVPPHEEVPWTREALCEGRDPVLARALELAAGGEAKR